MASFRWKDIFELIKDTFYKFIDDHAIYYSASLSFFTIFSLPPILIIIIAVAGTLLGKEIISVEIFQQIENLAGHDSAVQIQEMVNHANKAKSSTFAKSIAIITLIFASTGVFIAIQNALNIMWGFKPKLSLNIVKLIKDRILSFALIISIAFLLLVSLILHAGLVAIIKLMNVEFATILMLQLIHFIIPLGVITLLFAMIFKYLPDAKIPWKDVWVGAFVTAALFTAGKFLIGLYLGTSDISSAYGAAGTMIIILVWVFFSSIVLFLGAEFTHVYTLKYYKKVKPAEYAVEVETTTVEIPEAKGKKKS